MSQAITRHLSPGTSLSDARARVKFRAFLLTAQEAEQTGRPTIWQTLPALPWMLFVAAYVYLDMAAELIDWGGAYRAEGPPSGRRAWIDQSHIFQGRRPCRLSVAGWHLAWRQAAVRRTSASTAAAVANSPAKNRFITSCWRAPSTLNSRVASPA
jgi:hypothetical protein